MKFELVITNQEINALEALNLDDNINKIANKNVKLIIDMSKVVHISIAGIGVLAAAIRSCKKVIVKGCNTNILHKFDVLGINELVIIK